KFTLARLRVTRDETVAPPPVFIESLRVNGEEIVKLSELGESTVQNLEFNPNKQHVQFAFFALGFGTGERLLYQFKLEGGADTDWSPPTTERSVTFANLNYGSYRFLVRAVNAEGVASESPASVSFTIAQPLYRQIWFLLLAVIAVSVAVYMIYR